MRVSILAVGAVALIAGVAQADLIVNGGFETGDLTAWNAGGNLGFTAVTSNNIHTGNFSFQMGPIGSTGFIEQTLPLVAGNVATLDFWLAADAGGEVFSATLDGQTLLSGDSGNGFGYTEFTYNVTIGNNNPVLHFEFEHSPAYWYLDDVSVNVVPAPGSLALLGLGGLFAGRRRRA
jgi:hypothetical protein